ncbi:hypothetical protein CABS03_01669 [Colletotrichum abscissum]|uniref:Uncharacterized protein n=1 Tax=Colletotrichum limetticola TaxID=1209924 RepID=A0ABQ9PC33_9PEZI|nr:hypothetical protein CLIM01_13023 [Colletotrichum limetticola]
MQELIRLRDNCDETVNTVYPRLGQVVYSSWCLHTISCLMPRTLGLATVHSNALGLGARGVFINLGKW